MKRAIIILLVGATAWAVVATAQQRKSTTRAEVAKVRRRQPPIAGATPADLIDAHGAYKANCARCHLSTAKFSERKMATIMRHMRVRANLTEEEAEAIFRYLTR